MQKNKAKTLVFLIISSLIVIVALNIHSSTAAPYIERMASESCVACHTSADVILSMYEAPEGETGGGG